MATEGVHFLTSSSAVMDFIRTHYTLLPSREKASNGKERDDGKAKRKAEEEEEAEPSSKALKAAGGRKSASTGGEGKGEDAMEVDEEEEEEEEQSSKADKGRRQSKTKGDNPYDDNETYDDLQIDDGKLVANLKSKYNWTWRYSTLGTMYIRRKKAQGEKDAQWRRGIDYFEDEAEIKQYIRDKQVAVAKAKAEAEKVIKEEQVKRKREARADKQAPKASIKAKQEEPADDQKEVEVVEKKSRSKRHSSMASDMEAEVKKEPDVRTQSGRVSRRASNDSVIQWPEEEKFPDDPPSGDYHSRDVLARQINIWQKGTYAWQELSRWLGWKAISDKSTQRTPSGYIYLYPDGNPDGEENKDWFGTADAIRDWAREQVRSGKQLPIDPKKEEDNARKTNAKKAQKEQVEVEVVEEEEGSEEESSDEDASEEGEEEEQESFRATDSEAEKIRKMKQRGFQEVTHKRTKYLVAKGVDFSSKKGLAGLKEGSDYMLATAEAIGAWAYENEREESSDEEDNEDQEEGEEDEDAAKKRRKTQPRPLDPTILPADFKDFQGLIQKLRK